MIVEAVRKTATFKNCISITSSVLSFQTFIFCGNVPAYRVIQHATFQLLRLLPVDTILHYSLLAYECLPPGIPAATGGIFQSEKKLV